MANTAPSGAVASTASSSPRWGRSGDPGSAFNGLSRPGRGRGRGNARGGRGGGRGGNPSRDAKLDEERTTVKSDNPQTSSNTAPNLFGSSSISASLTVPEKSATVVPTVQKSPKPSSRRASRTIPPAVNTQIQTPEVTAAPSSAKLPNKRRRSQIGRGSAVIPAKINPPAPNDNLLRPNKPRLAPAPHTAPIKDTPPHLSQKLDMRNDIDALVERVRAVAMDHRPTTPGSHIDWAGDDDDSLPDLDDWGVTPATFNANRVDVISPIIVGALKSLPDITSNSLPNSPLKQAQNISLASTEPSPRTQSHDRQPEISVSLPVTIPSNLPNENKPEGNISSLNPHSSLENSNSISKKPLHPSLPAKPDTGSTVASLATRSGATPMRYSPHPMAVSSTITGKASSNFNEAASETTTEMKVGAPVDQTNVEEDRSSTPKPLEVVVAPPSGASRHPKSATVEATSHRLGDAPEGLAASIHAPKAMSDSVSAPPNLSSYPNLPPHSLHGPGLTHTRAHTVGRPPSFPKQHGQGQGDYVPRFARSGQSTPRGGIQEGYHARTHSSPPAGAMASHLRTPPSTRPVITGDAISRLARTIGRSGTSSSKPQPIVPLGD